MTNKEKVLQNTIQRCRDNNIIIPTYAQMRNPELIPDKIRQKLKSVGLWDLNPINLFRITWKNEPTALGGGEDADDRQVFGFHSDGILLVVGLKRRPTFSESATVMARFLTGS